MLMNKGDNIPHSDSGKRWTLFTHLVFPVALQKKDFQACFSDSPDFRNAQGSVDTHSIQNAASYVNLDGQIRRWILGEVNLRLANDQRTALKIKAVVGFQALIQAFTFESCAPGRNERDLQFLRQNHNNLSQ